MRCKRNESSGMIRKRYDAKQQYKGVAVLGWSHPCTKMALEWGCDERKGCRIMSMILILCELASWKLEDIFSRHIMSMAARAHNHTHE